MDLQAGEPIRAIENRRLRTTVWPSGRTLADGRVVGLAHVLRYEKAVGVPMA